MSDTIRPASDVRFAPAGPGCSLLRQCWGCSRPRLTAGSSGSGHRWRCAECAAKARSPAAATQSAP